MIFITRRIIYLLLVARTGWNRQLKVVEVGKGSSRSRESVQEELWAALAAEPARADASDDDET